MDEKPIIAEGADSEDAFESLKAAGQILGVHIDNTQSFNNASALLILNMALKIESLIDPTR